MAANDKILASAFNNIRTKIDSVLGVGSGDYGYGQTLYSTEVNGPSNSKSRGKSDKIHSEYWDLLRYDIISAYKHQNGQNPTISDIASGGQIQWYYAIQYDLLASNIVTNKDQAFIGATAGSYTKQLEVINGGSTDLDAGWGVNTAGQQNQQQQYFVTFNDTNHARYFFNSGGYLRITMSHENVVGSPNTKTVGWNNVVTNMNNQHFTFDNSKFRQGLAGTQKEWTYIRYDPTNPYSENYGLMRFKYIDARTIEVFVRLVDADTGDHDLWNSNNVPDEGDPVYFGRGVDEPIQSIISAGLEYRKSIDQVVIESPNFSVAPWVTEYQPSARSYSSPGNYQWIVPDGLSSVQVLLAGGGGGGGGGNSYEDPEYGSTVNAGGGGGGGEVKQLTYNVTPGQTIYITVGAGGTAGPAGSNGSGGTITTINGGITGLVTANGGLAGTSAGVGGNSGSGGLGSASGGGGGASNATSVVGGLGVDANVVERIYSVGGGGGGGRTNAAGGTGFNGGGTGGSSNTILATPGTPGSGGGGGGGGTQSYPGAQGGSGRVVIYG
jgi:hypothetical protein